MTPSHWTIHKFGGTSVASASRYKSVPNILTKHSKSTGLQNRVVAMSGVTMTLSLVELAKNETLPTFKSSRP